MTNFEIFNKLKTRSNEVTNRNNSKQWEVEIKSNVYGCGTNEQCFKTLNRLNQELTTLPTETIPNGNIINSHVASPSIRGENKIKDMVA